MWKRATRMSLSATTSPRSRRRTTPCRRNPSSPMRISFSASVPSSSILPVKPPQGRNLWCHAHRYGIHHQGLCQWVPAHRRGIRQQPVHHRGSSTASASPVITSCCLTVKAATASLSARWKPSDFSSLYKKRPRPGLGWGFALNFHLPRTACAPSANRRAAPASLGGALPASRSARLLSTAYSFRSSLHPAWPFRRSGPSPV